MWIVFDIVELHYCKIAAYNVEFREAPCLIACVRQEGDDLLVRDVIGGIIVSFH